MILCVFVFFVFGILGMDLFRGRATQRCVFVGDRTVAGEYVPLPTSEWEKSAKASRHLLMDGECDARCGAGDVPAGPSDMRCGSGHVECPREYECMALGRG